MFEARKFLATLPLLAALCGGASAVLYVWDGGGGNSNIYTAANWQGNIVPVNNGSAVLVFQGSARPDPYTLTMFPARGIYYPPGQTTAFTFTGARILLGEEGIRNESFAIHTINNDITLQDTPGLPQPHLFDAGPGQIVLNGDIDLASFEVDVFGPAQTTFNGEVSGVNGRIDVGGGPSSEAGKLRLTGNVAADVDVNIGELIIDTNQPQHPGTTLQFAGGTALSVLGTHTIDNKLQLNGEVTFHGTGSLNLTQDLTGSGSLRIDATSTAQLKLGSINNFSPFSGEVSIDQGRLRTDGAGIVAQLSGPIEVGDNSGAPATSRFTNDHAADLSTSANLSIRADGRVDLNGSINFGNLEIQGGDLYGGDPFTVAKLYLQPSTRRATIGAEWSLPLANSNYLLIPPPASGQFDVLFLGGCVGPGDLQITPTTVAGGSVELRGDPAAGPASIEITGSDLHLSRSGGSSMLSNLSVTNGNLTISNASDFVPTTELTLRDSASFDMGNFDISVGHLSLGESQILAGQGRLMVFDDTIDVSGNAGIAADIYLQDSFTEIDLDSDAELEVSVIEAGNDLVSVIGGGTLDFDDLFGELVVGQSTIQSTGYIDGDLTLHGELEFPAGATGSLDVNGSARLFSGSALDYQHLPATTGPRFPILQAYDVVDEFESVSFPTPPGAQYWTVQYEQTGVYLLYDDIEEAELDLRHGTHGVTQADESLDGSIGIDLAFDGGEYRELCSVKIEGVSSPTIGGGIGIRIYDAQTQTLLASANAVLPVTPQPQDVEIQLPYLFAPFTQFRMVVYAFGDVHLPTYTPLSLPYAQSTLLNVEGLYAAAGADVFPTVGHDRLPELTMFMGACDLTAVDDEPRLPVELGLAAMPNPFNPRTTLRFELPRPGRVQVDVFDARGRHVDRLLDAEKPAGRFELPWSGTDRSGGALGSGVYFVRLVHPSGERVRRVTLVK